MTQPRLILHIGGAKTGSSYLQHCFSLKRTELAEAGIVYPEHDSLARAARGQDTAGNGIALARFLREEVGEAETEALDDLARTMRTAEGRDVLLSSEFLLGFLPTRFPRLASVAEASGYRIVAVYYVRSVAGQALSAYKQRVKRHLETRSFTQWLSEEFRFRVAYVMGKLERFIDGASIHVHNFDHARADLFTHFARVALTPEAAGIAVPQRIVNRSLTTAEVELMRHLNGLFTDERQGAFVGNTLMQTPGDETATYVTPEQYEILRGEADGQLEHLNQRLPPDEAVDILGPDEHVRDERPPSFSANEKLLATLVAGLIASHAPR